MSNAAAGPRPPPPPPRPAGAAPGAPGATGAAGGAGGRMPKRPDPGSEDIALKINWIGIDPTRKTVPPNVRRRDGKRFRGPWVTFKCFRLWEETGRDLNDVAPRLFKRMFEE